MIPVISSRADNTDLTAAEPGSRRVDLMTSARNDEPLRRRIALIAHDHKKADLRDWARFKCGLLAEPRLPPPGTRLRLRRGEAGPGGVTLSFGGHDAG